MNEIYERQDDGSLKPLNQPEWVIQKVVIYRWLQQQGLTLEEIRFLLSDAIPNV